MTLRILLVDDHDLMRDGLRAILEKERDYEIVGEAAGGREAVRLVAEVEPDIVIMDVAMKDLNGIEATRQIRADHHGVAIIALSSHSDPRYVTAILRAGASAYVLKSNAYSQLKKAVQSVRVGRTFLCEEVSSVVIDAVRHPQAESASAYERLGAREREVLQLLAEGLTSSEIAKQLHIATSTVETHRRNLMRKLDLHGIAELTKYAIREGLTGIES
ncbi:MAG TPA: response regulator transcription factor [Myxococcota bacterium]|nr:response regulator transcription factor [Myxococcota bacterium]